MQVVGEGDTSFEVNSTTVSDLYRIMQLHRQREKVYSLERTRTLRSATLAHARKPHLRVPFSRTRGVKRRYALRLQTQKPTRKGYGQRVSWHT